MDENGEATSEPVPAEGQVVMSAAEGARDDGCPVGTADADMVLHDLRVTVESIGGRPVCGLSVGDYFELTESSRLSLPAGRHFCLYALAAVLPLLPAKQRDLPAADWLERDSLVACPDPDERLVMRITRTRRRALRSADLT
jgi:uncharacterized repeat protein (TIGR04076 family)